MFCFLGDDDGRITFDKWIYDSNTDAKSHRTKYLAGFTHGEKTKIDTTVGETIYVVVYTPPALQIATDPIGKFYNLTVGEPQMLYGSDDAVFAKTTVLAKPNKFSSSVPIVINNAPKTAQVTRMYMKTNATAGLTATDIQAWSLRLSTDSMQYDAPQFTYFMDIPYELFSPYNLYVNGTWYFSIKLSSFSDNITFTPGLSAQYQYEQGD